MAKDKKDRKMGIYIDAQELWKVLYATQFEVDKKDRASFFPRAFDHCEKIISYFSLAFNTQSKIKYIELMWSEFEALKVELRLAVNVEDLHLIRNEKRHNEIRELIVRMNEEIISWHRYVSDARQE